MAAEEEEIEYLEEDAEIVEQLLHLQKHYPEPSKEEESTDEELDETIASLLVKRPTVTKRKHEDQDSDYDPQQDLEKKKAPAKKHQKISSNDLPNQKSTKTSSKTVKFQKEPEKSQLQKDYEERKKFQIRIPDFEDPLCLPVKAIKNERNDLQRLQSWNNLCLKQHRNIDLNPKENTGRIVGSTRSMTFRNVKNKNLGKLETVVNFRNVTRDEQGVRQIEQFNGTLPRYREKRTLNFKLAQAINRPIRNRHIALLNKESIDKASVLVVYKPRDCVSAVYTLDKEERENAPPHLILNEKSSVKQCASCYQVSWRGASERGSETMFCKICKRSFVSVYNMLSHLKTHHKAEDVRRHKVDLSMALAKVVQYHYRCRICQTKCHSIKMLKTHVGQHKGDEVFQCEVGNHMAS